MDSYHLMELPTKVLIGDGVISRLGEFLRDSAGEKRVVVSAGSNVTSKVEGSVDSALGKKPTWVRVTAADMDNVRAVMSAAAGAGCIVGVGGGKSVDVGKLAAFRLRLPFYSVPTSASHDGISSPFASLKGLDRPYSIMAKPPVGILADIDIISSAPRRLLASGCGDLVSKLTAVKDWQLAYRVTGEYYGGYSASLALMSASVVLDHPRQVMVATPGTNLKTSLDMPLLIIWSPSTRNSSSGIVTVRTPLERSMDAFFASPASLRSTRALTLSSSVSTVFRTSKS